MHLDQTLFGAADVPPEALDLFANAPLEAARRVFDLAVEHQVDGLLLAGDIVDFRRAAAAEHQWLGDQLARMHDRAIAVFWLDGTAERRGRWPAELPLPAGVHRFHGPAPHAVDLVKGGSRLATVVAAAPLADQPIDPWAWEQGDPDLPRVALIYARRAPNRVGELPVDYAALGGRHRRRVLSAPRHLAHYSGAPQGFSPSQPGPHGCWLIRIDAQRRVRRKFLATDVARWHTVDVDADVPSEPDKLVDRMLAECGKFPLTPSDPVPLVRWRVLSAPRGLREDDQRQELLARLRQESAKHPAVSRVVNLAIDLVPEPHRPEQLNEDSLLGDFLRAVEQRRGQALAPPEIPAALAGLPHAQRLARLRTASPAYQRQLWEQVVRLGTELLRPEPIEES
jgi:DNA repair exonuclease SbcCD nuclease subunit